jgi:transcriptional regulator of acetoin/glycerol metabolism
VRTPHIWQKGETLADVEIDLILSCLRQTQGNVKMVSQELSIARSTLYKRLKKLSLSTQDEINQWLLSHIIYGPDA